MTRARPARPVRPAHAPQPTLEPLSADRCWELLETGWVGRVAVNVEGEAPLVVPVNYQVEDRTLVFRSGVGTKLDAARQEQIALQVDQVDPLHRTGWSVLVRGVTTIEVREASEEPIPWAGLEGRDSLVRLWPAHVTGRMLEAPEHEWDLRGYL